MEGEILIVEDSPIYGKLIAYNLTQSVAYRTQVVQTGCQALNTVKDTPPLILILDHHLPDMTGIELYDKLHDIEEWKYVPAIMLSADLPDEQLFELLAKRGMIGLSKPVHIEHLLQAVDMLLEKHGLK